MFIIASWRWKSDAIFSFHNVIKNGRNTAGNFTSGNSGRPKGVCNNTTIAVQSLVEGQGEALTQTAISKS